jgi:hypothetical protein
MYICIYVDKKKKSSQIIDDSVSSQSTPNSVIENHHDNTSPVSVPSNDVLLENDAAQMKSQKVAENRGYALQYFRENAAAVEKYPDLHFLAKLNKTPYYKRSRNSLMCMYCKCRNVHSYCVQCSYITFFPKLIIVCDKCHEQHNENYANFSYK